MLFSIHLEYASDPGHQLVGRVQKFALRSVASTGMLVILRVLNTFDLPSLENCTIFKEIVHVLCCFYNKTFFY